MCVCVCARASANVHVHEDKPNTYIMPDTVTGT